MGMQMSAAYGHKNKVSKGKKGLHMLQCIDEQATLKLYGYDVDWKSNVGEGSYSKVKKGFSRHLNHAVAVKIITKTAENDSHAKKFFSRELSILGKLNHPNIVSCEEIIQLDKKIFIMMDLATEGDLLDYVLRKECLSEKITRHIFLPLVSAVGYLHNMNILHRDLKCENVLLYDGLIPKLTDFGFAKCSNNVHSLSQTFCGSQGYAAYEVLKGLPYDGVKSDIWSLGVILYVMSFGTMPFDDVDRKTQLDDMEQGLRFCNRFKKTLTDTLQDLMRKILNIDVSNRLSIDTIKDHLWLLGLPTLDSPRIEKAKLCDLITTKS